VRGKGRIRLGTRIITPEGDDTSVLEMILQRGGTVGDDGLIRVDEVSPGLPFHWEYGETLPSPEDYVLQRSGLSIGDLNGCARASGEGLRLN